MKILATTSLLLFLALSASSQDIVYEQSNTLGVLHNPAFSALNDFSRVGLAVKNINGTSQNTAAFGNIALKPFTVNLSLLDDASGSRGFVRSVYQVGLSKKFTHGKFGFAIGSDFALRRTVVEHSLHFPTELHDRLGFVPDPDQPQEIINSTYVWDLGGVISYDFLNLFGSYRQIHDQSNMLQIGLMSIHNTEKFNIQYGATYTSQAQFERLDASAGIGYKFLKLGAGTRVSDGNVFPKVYAGIFVKRFDFNFCYLRKTLDADFIWVDYELALTYSFFKKDEKRQHLLF